MRLHLERRRSVRGTVRIAVAHPTPVVRLGIAKALEDGYPGLPYMEYGNKPTDGGYLILSSEERDQLLADHLEPEPYVKHFMGSEEVVKGKIRHCLWVTDEQAARNGRPRPAPSRQRKIDYGASRRRRRKSFLPRLRLSEIGDSLGVAEADRQYAKRRAGLVKKLVISGDNNFCATVELIGISNL